MNHLLDKQEKSAKKNINLSYVTQLLLLLFLFSGESCKKQSEEAVSEKKNIQRIGDKTIIVPKDYVSRNLIEFQINLLKALKKRQWNEIKQYIFGEGIIDNCLVRKEKISLQQIFDKLKTERIKIISKNKSCKRSNIPKFYKQNHCPVSNYCETLDFYLDINQETYKLELEKLVKLRGKWWVTGNFQITKK